MSDFSLKDLEARRLARDEGVPVAEALCAVRPTAAEIAKAAIGTPSKAQPFISSLPASHSYLPDLASGLTRNTHPTLVIGVQSDTLFPVEQQRELAECLKSNGNSNVTYFELTTPWGHDSFLLDVNNVGSAIRGFLE